MRVTLNGIVSTDEDVEIYEWFGYKAFGPQTIRQALDVNPAGEDLVFEINSPGGSVFAGSEMYSVLRSAENVRTRAEIQSIAASAASYFSLGCDEVWMSPAAQLMIHLPSTSTEGNRSNHLESIQMLDTVRDSILNVYELKSGGKADRAEFKRMMNASTWLTAQEAVEKGLADGILYQEAAMPPNIMNALGSGIRALGESGGVPDIVHLRAEFRRSKEAETGHAPAADSQDWRRNARLAIENNRFLLGGI